MMLDVFFGDVFVFMLPVHPPLAPNKKTTRMNFASKKNERFFQKERDGSSCFSSFSICQFSEE